MGWRTVRPGEGHVGRLSAYLALLTIAFLGVGSLRASAEGWGTWMREPLTSRAVPVLGLQLTPALLLSIVVFVGTAVGLRLFLNRPKVVDLLVSTEEELRRVTWPSWSDAVNSSLVVIGTVVVLGAFLSLTDMILGELFRRILFGVS
jgi:preprotein translocase SecE subunit